MLAWSWGRWPEVVLPFGRALYVPWQLAAGKVLYTDIAYFNAPLSPYLNALCFRRTRSFAGGAPVCSRLRGVHSDAAAGRVGLLARAMPLGRAIEDASGDRRVAARPARRRRRPHLQEAIRELDEERLWHSCGRNGSGRSEARLQ
jgi:hypothetical protein